MHHKGYTDALNLAKEELAKRNPEEIVQNTGVIFNGESFIIPWYNQMVPLEEGAIEEQILWYHYMLAQGPKNTRDRFIAYKQVPGAAIYNESFVKRCINPMVKVFSNDLERFLKNGKLLGGEQVNHGHMAVTIRPLPYIPITYILWQGDDEMPASGNVLFDETALEWLCAEDLVVLASLPVYKMMKL